MVPFFMLPFFMLPFFMLPLLMLPLHRIVMEETLDRTEFEQSIEPTPSLSEHQALHRGTAQ
jgi:hypothetical protein